MPGEAVTVSFLWTRVPQGSPGKISGGTEVRLLHQPTGGVELDIDAVRYGARPAEPQDRRALERIAQAGANGVTVTAHQVEPRTHTQPTAAGQQRRGVPRLPEPFTLRAHLYAPASGPLNDAGIDCPSAADPARNQHRTGQAWKLTTVRAILANPVYTGRQVWGRTRTDHDLIDPANTALGHRDTARWNTPDQWIISAAPAHPALISEADFVAVQGMRATREDAKHPYQLAGLLRCALCGRTFEGHWVNHVPGYRCRHGHTSATTPDPDRPKNTYLREDRILAALPLLHHRLTTPEREPTSATAGAAPTTPPTPQEVIDHLRTHALQLSYDPQTRTLEIASQPPARITI